MKSNPTRFLWTVIALGWAFDFLFWKKAPGVNFAIYVALCLIAGILLLRADGHRPTRNSLLLYPPGTDDGFPVVRYYSLLDGASRHLISGRALAHIQFAGLSLWLPAVVG